MVKQSLYQPAATVDAQTNAEMETFAMAVIQKVLSNTLLVTFYQDNDIVVQNCQSSPFFSPQEGDIYYCLSCSLAMPLLDTALLLYSIPFRHSSIPPLRHSITIPSFRHSAIILPFCHSAIPPFCHSRHSLHCHFRQFFFFGLRRSYINSVTLQPLCLHRNFFQSTTQYCTILHTQYYK